MFSLCQFTVWSTLRWRIFASILVNWSEGFSVFQWRSLFSYIPFNLAIHHIWWVSLIFFKVLILEVLLCSLMHDLLCNITYTLERWIFLLLYRLFHHFLHPIRLELNPFKWRVKVYYPWGKWRWVGFLIYHIIRGMLNYPFAAHLYVYYCLCKAWVESVKFIQLGCMIHITRHLPLEQLQTRIHTLKCTQRRWVYLHAYLHLLLIFNLKFGS